MGRKSRSLILLIYKNNSEGWTLGEKDISLMNKKHLLACSAPHKIAPLCMHNSTYDTDVVYDHMQTEGSIVNIEHNVIGRPRLAQLNGIRIV